MRSLKMFLALAAIYIVTPAFSQEDITAILNTEKQPVERVRATFKTTRIINIQTNETVHKRTLDFRVAHRFGAIGNGSGGNGHNLYGFDISTDIRIAFEYGITDKIGIGAKASYSSIGTAATQTFLGGVINWHSNIEDNDALDFYTGATVGVPFTSGNGISATGNLSILAQLGVRYYFTEQIGGFAELGYAILNPIGSDKLAGNVGISFKF